MPLSLGRATPRRAVRNSHCAQAATGLASAHNCWTDHAGTVSMSDRGRAGTPGGATRAPREKGADDSTVRT